MAAAELLILLKVIAIVALNVKNTLQKFGQNPKDCGRLSSLMGRVSDVVENLKRTPNINNAMSGAVKGLEEAMQRASKFIVTFQKKNKFFQAIDAHDIADKLRRFHDDISNNLNLVTLATVSKIGRAVSVHPNLQRQVSKYTTYQDKSRRETTKMDLSRPGVKIDKYNGRLADSKVPRGHLARKPAGGGGSSKKSENRVKNIDGRPNTPRLEGMNGKTLYQRKEKAPRPSVGWHQASSSRGPATASAGGGINCNARKQRDVATINYNKRWPKKDGHGTYLLPGGTGAGSCNSWGYQMQWAEAACSYSAGQTTWQCRFRTQKAAVYGTLPVLPGAGAMQAFDLLAAPTRWP